MNHTFREVFDMINDDLMDRYNLPPGFFEDREKLIPVSIRGRPNLWIKNYIRLIMRYINTHRMKVMNDQYLILQLDDQLKRALSQLPDDRHDSITTIIDTYKNKIYSDSRYVQFYRSLGELIEKIGVDYPESFEDLKTLIKTRPDVNWNLSCADWFGCMNDDRTIKLIGNMQSLIELIELIT